MSEEKCPTCGGPALVTQRTHGFGCDMDGDVVGRETGNDVCTCIPSASAWHVATREPTEAMIEAAYQSLGARLVPLDRASVATAVRAVFEELRQEALIRAGQAGVVNADVEIAPGGPWYTEYQEHGEYRRGWRIVERTSAREFVIPAPDYSEREALAICVALNGLVH